MSEMNGAISALPTAGPRTAEEFTQRLLVVGREMRKAQVEYFRHRDRDLLIESKRLERMFDNLVLAAAAACETWQGQKRL